MSLKELDVSVIPTGMAKECPPTKHHFQPVTNSLISLIPIGSLAVGGHPHQEIALFCSNCGEVRLITGKDGKFIPNAKS